MPIMACGMTPAPPPAAPLRLQIVLLSHGRQYWIVWCEICNRTIWLSRAIGGGEKRPGAQVGGGGHGRRGLFSPPSRAQSTGPIDALHLIIDKWRRFLCILIPLWMHTMGGWAWAPPPGRPARPRGVYCRLVCSILSDPHQRDPPTSIPLLGEFQSQGSPSCLYTVGYDLHQLQRYSICYSPLRKGQTRGPPGSMLCSD